MWLAVTLRASLRLPPSRLALLLPHRRGMAEYLDHVPKYAIRWLRPAYSTALLDLPTSPIDQSAADTWRAFTDEESVACEEAWQRLPRDQRLESGENVIAPRETTDDAHLGVDRDEDVVGVAIYKDRLYEVSRSPGVKRLCSEDILFQVDVRTMHVRT
jgi:hypothetical protein